MTADDIQYPSGFGLQDVVGWGTTGLVVLDKPTSTVVKAPLDDENEPLIAREKQVYERFAEKGGHKGLLGYFGTFESGIRLQHASNYHLRSTNKKGRVSENQRLSWVIQIAEAMDFIHKAGVIHGDLTCANIFLDEELNAKLADFAGSSIDGSPLLVAVPASHEYPGSLLSIQGDLFAFGCIVYEIMTQQIPHHGKTDGEIRGLYTRGVFPDTSSLGALGGICKKCWLGQYPKSEALVQDLKGMYPNFRHQVPESLIPSSPANNLSHKLDTPPLAIITTSVVVYSRLLAQAS
ncbi:hypothetical protein CDV31_013465 [Fusarium ambrosium]|uniref:EKC/KEOPS complex subunit BUD32 n=1 Tax=Fusarium ambrosium TaxID=131363 RepID=A0A428T338_9HYPO|nr:hypothetical protein CDV31_013465 [Fusarium ambrosium]